jgi:hypothetical protein
MIALEPVYPRGTRHPIPVFGLRVTKTARRLHLRRAGFPEDAELELGRAAA